MKKLHKTRDFLAGMLAMALIVTMVAPAGAALVSKTIQVFTGLEIYVDGVKMNPTDANGKPVETFAYNGTTYVPLRAVSQSLGKNVKYDSATKRVYIGEVPGEKQYLLNVCPPYEKDGANLYPLPKTFEMMGKKYTNGFSVSGISSYALINLDGQYDHLSFDVGHLDGSSMFDTTLFIYLDDQLVWSQELTAEMQVEHISISVSNALRLKIITPEVGSIGAHNSCWGLGNITLE